MAGFNRRLCFFLCVFIMVAILFLFEMTRIKPNITLSFPSPHATPEDKPTQVTFNLEECPCPRDLGNVKVVPKVMETNFVMLINYFHMNKLKARRDLGRRRETIDLEFEAPLLAHPPIYHADCLPDHKRSKVVLLTPHEDISTGSSVQFRIDLYNRKGQPRCAGGDEVRAWLKSKDGRSSVAAEVKDLQNGSYVGETVLPWPGVTLLRVSLTYPQEYLRLCVEMYHTFHSMRYTIEKFKFGNTTERVPCLPSYPIPGYAKFCNFTAANGDYPWYCGHPVTKPLNCSHRFSFTNLDFTSYLPIPPPFQQYTNALHKCCGGPNADMRLIPNNIKLKARPEKRAAPHPLPPCHSRPVRESWLSPSPRGWLRDGQWIASNCALPDLDDQTVARCLKNTTLMLLGDSNQRILWEGLLPFVNCTTRNKPEWNAPHVCLSDELRAALLFAVHAMPFNPGIHGGTPVANLPLPMALNFAKNLSYPNTHNLVMVIHYYLHLSTSPVQVYRNFVQKARRTVQEYLKLHPKVKFVVRGPHLLYGNQPQSYMGDKFAHWYQRIWQKEFAELRDRVWYMDTWDLTVAVENQRNHPESVTKDIARILLGYICDGL